MKKLLPLLLFFLSSIAQATPLDDLFSDIEKADAEFDATVDAAQVLKTEKIKAAEARYKEAITLPTLALKTDVAKFSEEGGHANISIDLSKVWIRDIVVIFGFSGEALLDTDYTASADRVTIKAGETTGKIILTGKSDDVIEPDKSLTVTVTKLLGARVVEPTKVDLTVTSDDVEPPTVSLSSDIAEVVENGGRAKVTATLSRAWTKDASLSFKFGGDAIEDTDYSVTADEVLIKAGDTTGSITVSAIDNNVVDADRTVTVAIDGTPIVVTGDPVSILITNEDVVVPPPDPTQPYTVKPEHPRIYWHNDIRARIIAAPSILKYVAQIADTDATTRSNDTPLCCAALWLLSKDGGLPPPPMVAGKPTFKYLFTAEQYRDRAIAKAVAIAGTQINLAGTHYGTNHLHVLATLYDWMYNDMTDSQRATIRATLTESLVAAFTKKRVDSTGKPIPVQNPNIYWEGYNDDSGGGMTVALAVYGETEVDWVKKYWDENWWAIPPPESKGIGGFYNRQYERDWLVGGGNNEDWGYFGNQLLIRAARHAWETATGDRTSLDYPFLSRNSLLYTHQSVLLPYGTGKRLKHLPTYGNGNGFLSQGEAFWFAAGTGSDNPKFAALSAWIGPQVLYPGQPAFDEFFWRCVVGDPRVQAKTPTELSLPLDYYVESTGLYYDRTDWTDDATRVFFGCSEQVYRSTASGNTMVWSKGLPLIADRSGTYDHGYSGYGRACLPMIRVEATGKLLAPLSGDGTPRRVKVASFKKDGNKYTADLTKLYPSSVTRMIRSFEFDRAANTVTITDECTPKAGYLPTAGWPTPLRPLVNNTSVVFTNGRATAEMTFDVTPSEVTFRGGEIDNLWAEDYDRTLYNVAGTATWRKLSIPDQILAGGYYTVYVTPAKGDDGTYRLTTTLKVQ